MNGNKKPLIECFGLDYDKNMITEAVQRQQPIIVPALLQRAEIPNSNGRIYPRPILAREIEKYKNFVNSNMAMGEVDHPESDPVVNLKNVGIVVREIYWEGNDVKGKVEVLNKVPAGQIICGLMEHGLRIGISSRGVGSTIQEGGKELVDDDYTLLCFDAVSIGSVEGAGFLTESGGNIGQYLAEGFSLDAINNAQNKNTIVPAALNNNQAIHNILNQILKIKG